MLGDILKKISIPRRACRCVKCNALFIEGMEYRSWFLDCERKDYCLSCSGVCEGIYWKSKVPIKQNQNLKQHERILNLLFEENQTDLGGVLALYLARQKVIIQRGDFDSFLHLFEVLDTEEMLTVKKVDIRTLDLEKIQFEISKRLCAEAVD